MGGGGKKRLTRQGFFSLTLKLILGINGHYWVLIQAFLTDWKAF
jgi:hypothetical protein